MTLKNSLLFFVALVFVGTVSACAYLEQAKQSDAFKKFCDWAPVAIVGIDQAVIEAQKDPVKLRVGQAMTEASGYLKLVAGQCQAPVMAVK